MKHGKRNIRLTEIADYLTKTLTAEGFKISRIDAKTTPTIYLKLDYGVCNTIRISDHYSWKYRYNIGPYVRKFKVEHGRYDRYYYQPKRMDELARRVLKDKRSLIKRYGRSNYNRWMKENNHDY